MRVKIQVINSFAQVSKCRLLILIWWLAREVVMLHMLRWSLDPRVLLIRSSWILLWPDNNMMNDKQHETGWRSHVDSQHLITRHDGEPAPQHFTRKIDHFPDSLRNFHLNTCHESLMFIMSSMFNTVIYYQITILILRRNLDSQLHSDHIKCYQ